MRSTGQPTSPISVALALVTLWGQTASASPTPTSPTGPEPIVVKVDDGFSWGDAGIGAAAGFGAALILAGSLSLSARKDERPTQPRPQEDREP